MQQFKIRHQVVMKEHSEVYVNMPHSGCQKMVYKSDLNSASRAAVPQSTFIF